MPAKAASGVRKTFIIPSPFDCVFFAALIKIKGGRPMSPIMNQRLNKDEIP